MSSLLLILIGAVLVNTFLLMHRDETLGGDRESGSAVSAMRIAGASLVTLLLATLVTVAIWRLLRLLPGDLLLFVFSFAVVGIAIGLHRITRRRLPRLRRSLATSPLLIVSNCLALGSILLNPISESREGLAIFYATALGVAFAALLTTFVTLAARIVEREVPMPFRVGPITLVSAGLFALALTGLTGLVRA